MSRGVDFVRCGTQKSWEKHAGEYKDMYKVIPATVYIKDGGICLVTSQEWVDWLLGHTDKIPEDNDGKELS